MKVLECSLAIVTPISEVSGSGGVVPVVSWPPVVWKRKSNWLVLVPLLYCQPNCSTCPVSSSPEYVVPLTTTEPYMSKSLGVPLPPMRLPELSTRMSIETDRAPVPGTGLMKTGAVVALDWNVSGVAFMSKT